MVTMNAADMRNRPAGRISLIVAMAENRVIGSGGTIPWKVPGEQKLFKRITLGHTLIMGRKTHEDIGRPLSDRINIVISRRKDYRPQGCLTAHSLQGAFDICPADETEVFIIGGGQLFQEALPIADRIYLTKVPLQIPGDTFFPVIPEDQFAITSSEHFEGPQPYDLHIYDRTRKNSKPETQEKNDEMTLTPRNHFRPRPTRFSILFS
jgi:dihydrofolate reductase